MHTVLVIGGYLFAIYFFGVLVGGALYGDHDRRSDQFATIVGAPIMLSIAVALVAWPYLLGRWVAPAGSENRWGWIFQAVTAVVFAIMIPLIVKVHRKRKGIRQAQ